MYSLQSNRHGILIVCKDEVPRNTYTIIHTGSYQECLEIKAKYLTQISQAKALITRALETN
jgi:hypothetical protein